ncbi:hypothetical protein RI367_006037 [Sorochytrium milnesiophthora]
MFSRVGLRAAATQGGRIATVQQLRLAARCYQLPSSFPASRLSRRQYASDSSQHTFTQLPNTAAAPPKTVPVAVQTEQVMVAKEHSKAVSLESVLKTLRSKSRTIIRVSIAGAGLYALYWFTSTVTDFWIGFTLWDMGQIGFFVGGVLSTGLLAGAYALSTRFGIRSPSLAREQVFQRLLADETLRVKLGGNVQLGELRAHAYTGGFQKRRAWKDIPYYTWSGARRLQLIFSVNGVGAADRAVVTADITRKTKGQYIFRSLVVDVDKSGERLIYEGDEKSALFRTLLKTRAA